ncbi:hypothetical protein J7481_19555 [Labrenzia sp. R4_2]|uniref:hypothetical protein n=1 Tax=Labrenzia sp. R4_2 TaxID=2821107 RepID=UPI001ADB2B70|nr:hypothetical protein [Labrenzia sp. R4_2]MBO9421713.1 hypothetical protein [Labrenzia sp. R4_2]
MSERFPHPVLATLRHNGTRYAPDDPDRNIVELTDREAMPLKRLKVVGESLASEPASDPAATEQPAAPSGEGREQAIAAAIASLNPETDFTQAGTPKVKAVELAAGFDVTADEVASLWEAAKSAE